MLCSLILVRGIFTVYSVLSKKQAKKYFRGRFLNSVWGHSLQGGEGRNLWGLLRVNTQQS